MFVDIFSELRKLSSSEMKENKKEQKKIWNEKMKTDRRFSDWYYENEENFKQYVLKMFDMMNDFDTNVYEDSHGNKQNVTTLQTNDLEYESQSISLLLYQYY